LGGGGGVIFNVKGKQYRLFAFEGEEEKGGNLNLNSYGGKKKGIAF